MKRLPFLLLLLTLLGCEKRISLPRATENGRGIIGFKVNGVRWATTRNKDFVVSYGASGTLSLSASLPNHNAGVHFWVTDAIHDVGPIDQDRIDHRCSSGISCFAVSDYSTSPAIRYFPAEGLRHRFEITGLDQRMGIIAGEFEFTMINRDDPNDTLWVTDGRFDVNTTF
ncbi:MAG: hypothetical protein AAF804_20895 [Bacteroidota bacterium]